MKLVALVEVLVTLVCVPFVLLLQSELLVVLYQVVVSLKVIFVKAEQLPNA